MVAKEAVVGVLEPGHFFGEGCLNGHPLRVTPARAEDVLTVHRLSAALAAEAVAEAVATCKQGYKVTGATLQLGRSERPTLRPLWSYGVDGADRPDFGHFRMPC